MSQETHSVWLITGGSRGIGRAIALRAAVPGAVILFTHFDPDESMARDALKALEERGARARAYYFDIAQYDKVQEVIGEILKEFGPIDVLVNNAGITRDALLMRMKETDWDLVLSVNLKGAFNCTQAVIREMLKRRSGRIINIASVAGQMGNAGQANYSASKAGLMGFTRSVAKEVASRGITVNAIAPGFIDTEMTQVLPEKVREEMLKIVPAGRMGSPEDVAETAFFLASPAASYITGQVLHVNGGMYM
jgi:3-oxoacyl-[acyl-carrier protein] reductase